MIATDRLTKRYGTLEELADVDLRVEEDSIYGFVGSNGFGKTTALEILVGIRKPGIRPLRCKRPCGRRSARPVRRQLDSSRRSSPRPSTKSD